LEIRPVEAEEAHRTKRKRSRERLSAVEVTHFVKRPRGEKTSLLHDGAGLYLIRDKRGGLSWAYKYHHAGRSRTLGLGAWPDCDLATARRKHGAARTALKVENVDPVQQKRQEAAAQRLAIARAMTFKQVGEAWLKSKQDGWRSRKSTVQPESLLKRYAYPIIGDLPVGEIDVGLIMQVLEQEVIDAVANLSTRLWVKRRDTGRKLRGHLKAVLGWASAQQLRAADNPARWEVLRHLLPAPAKLKEVKPVAHHAALPYREIKPFLEALTSQGGMAARALELVIATAARTGEVLGATWGEIDWKAETWTIPPERTKIAAEHCVPLNAAALRVLRSVKPEEPGPNELLFPGSKPGRPLSNMSMSMVLRRTKHGDLTVHGFRSTFRDWGAEKTTFARELLEKALGHVVGDGTERSYQRGPMLERRRSVMESWGAWCERGPTVPGGTVSDLEELRRATAS
jgi:integrase